MFATPTTFAEFEEALRRLVADRSAARIGDEFSGGAWIHGGGDYGRGVARLLDDAGFAVDGFIDRRAGPAFAEIDGRPVVHPEAFEAAQAQGKAFIGGVMNPNASSREMLA